MLNAIIPYDSDAVGPSPGARYVAKYRRQADWHERLLLWKLRDSEWIIVTPHGDRYVEDLADYEARHWMTGRNGYPGAVAGNVVAFDLPLDINALTDLITEARRECITEQQDKGYDIAVSPNALSWNGESFVLPAAGGMVEGVRRRLRGKRLPPRATQLPLRDVGADQVPAADIGVLRDSLDAPPGFVWAIADVGGSGIYTFGCQVTLPSVTTVIGRRALATFGTDLTLFCELTPVSEYGSFVKDRWKILDGLMPKPGRSPQPVAEYGFEVGDDDQDIRTQWTRFDPPESTNRYKDWRTSVDESSQHTFQESGGWFRGTPQALEIARRMERSSGNPKRWLADFARDKNLGTRDRNYYELDCLCSIVTVAGTIDQLNLGGSLALEIAFRRISGLAEAMAGGAANINWQLANFVIGDADSTALLSSERRSEVARDAREHLELSNLRTRLATSVNNAGASDSGSNAAAAVDAGGLPVVAEIPTKGGGKGGRPRVKAKAKGRSTEGGDAS